MSSNNIRLNSNAAAINRGFSRQSLQYDEADRRNIILQDLRKQVYKSAMDILAPRSHILELNAGTGIDALYFASLGHRVHATDLSDGMIAEIEKKISLNPTSGLLTCQQVSYEDLDQVQGAYDLVFSNFGGLNCTQNLTEIAKHLPSLLRPKAYVMWVIMPKVCPWEFLWALKGKLPQAVRRLRRGGVLAHVEGEYFQTYYHSVADVQSALGPHFTLVHAQSLALLSPPPHATTLVEKHPRLYEWLRKMDALLRDRYPFSRWGDHIIVTLRFQG